MPEHKQRKFGTETDQGLKLSPVNRQKPASARPGSLAGETARSSQESRGRAEVIIRLIEFLKSL